VRSVDELQALRMSVMWPIVVGCAAFLLARSIFWFFRPHLSREHGAACLVVGFAGAVVAWTIAIAWDNGPSYWVAFTAGMLALAAAYL